MTDLAHIYRVYQRAELLYDRPQVELALRQLAEQINRQLAETNPLVLTVLNGGTIAAGILLPYLNFPLECDYIHASRYRGETTGGERLHWYARPQTPLRGRTVLLVDDILDQGDTLAALIDYCQSEGAAAVYSAVMARKNIATPQRGRADFIALELPDRYLFGMGLDYKGYWRNAAGIFAVEGI
ncbi:hypoxanthine-guanine phosphoribosyltransferase [Ectothiorhodospiraceae bacterium BW-2]|nr:hypoxanthine-guanine phosphoribosyltransferase [Ectothiorhodospiraceae bacterium BW-2]